MSAMKTSVNSLISRPAIHSTTDYCVYSVTYAASHPPLLPSLPPLVVVIVRPALAGLVSMTTTSRGRRWAWPAATIKARHSLTSPSTATPVPRARRAMTSPPAMTSLATRAVTSRNPFSRRPMSRLGRRTATARGVWTAGTAAEPVTTR